jgi:ribosome-binding factor A
MSQRTRRVGDLIRRELSQLLLRELRDPRVKLATVSEVEVTADLSLAHVRVSVLGPDSDREATIAALEHASGFLRRQIARRLNLRVTPELRFHLDRGAEHSENINRLLEELGAGDPSVDS